MYYTNMTRTPLDMVASWVDLCVGGFSPWLFVPGKQYKVVDTLHVVFHGDGCDNAAVAAVATWREVWPNAQVTLTKNATLCIQFPRSRYDPWAHLFTFEWETLTLHVDLDFKTECFFMDKEGRKSYGRLYHDGSGFAEGEGLTSPGIIPWLPCVS